jgi:hypothetical protein
MQEDAMSPDNDRKLAKRIAAAGEAALAARGHVTAIDILVGAEWLATPQVERWRRARCHTSKPPHSRVERGVVVRPDREEPGRLVAIPDSSLAYQLATLDYRNA